MTERRAPVLPSDSKTDLTDGAVVQAFVKGDIAAFQKIYAVYRQRVFSYCVYYMGDHALAEDAFQEVFTRAYTRRDQLREVKALKSWLLLITRSVCLNMLRTSKFTPQFVSIDRENEHLDQPSRLERELSQETIDQHLSNDVLRSALQKLAPMYREAFLLREIEGYEYHEIAELTGATELNVKVRITRAKKQLRVVLSPYFAQELGARSRSVKPTKNRADEPFSAGDYHSGELSTGEEALAV
jgi:RNA polymerase sigma-70 factor, ECF subfamily